MPVYLFGEKKSITFEGHEKQKGSPSTNRYLELPLRICDGRSVHSSLTTVARAKMLLSGLSALPHVAPDEQYQFIVDVCSSHVDQLLAGNSFEQKL